MNECFTEKRFFYWVEDNTSVSLRAKSGSYGGGSETLITDAIGFDSYNQQAAGETSKPLTNKATDTDHTPVVISDYVVRRLTPVECERLQNFPKVRKVRFSIMTKDEKIAFALNEKWIIADTEGGKVYVTRGPGGVELKEPKLVEGSNLKGYRAVTIHIGEEQVQCRLHRVIWIAARGVIPDGYVIDHINNDKTDNRIANLQLLTSEDNSKKARKDGLYLMHEDNKSARITNEMHDMIQYVYGNSDLSIRALSEVFGISRSRVQQIIHEEGWTDIGEWTDTNGKKHTTADSARYKALGNSICTAAWVDILQSIAERIPEGEEKTMASLFDGIGGFPLIWERDCGGKTVWASEIEEFCIAVTERRFNEDRSLIGSRSQAVNVERERERVGLLHRERTTARCNDPERGNEQDSELLGRPDEGADNCKKKRVFDNNITDSRITECGDTAFSVTSHYGTGGNNQPIVLEEG